jgi:hypothetical protein
VVRVLRRGRVDFACWGKWYGTRADVYNAMARAEASEVA